MEVVWVVFIAPNHFLAVAPFFVGKSRAAIANYLRLLKLPAQVQMALQKKEIDMGHCRALLALDSPGIKMWQIYVFSLFYASKI